MQVGPHDSASSTIDRPGCLKCSLLPIGKQAMPLTDALPSLLLTFYAARIS
ncbi:hypothetical protein Pan44_17390 [Caulifigura coniformis]|uniref:Uncharacterized protein n=1 Tax=Caulifigura coniformis TaxID=2527983 RepID=A0A517SC97_9PLAN|nr:hypothetical protein Pan44_17390 [Caulifigura coniformis]